MPHIRDLLKVIDTLSRIKYPNQKEEEKDRQEILKEAYKKLKSTIKGGDVR